MVWRPVTVHARNRLTRRPWPDAAARQVAGVPRAGRLVAGRGQTAGVLGSRAMPVSRLLSRRVSSRWASIVQARTGAVAIALRR
jgi:hypothetical protein